MVGRFATIKHTAFPTFFNSSKYLLFLWILLTIFLLDCFLIVGDVQANSPRTSTLQIREVYTNLPQIKVWLDVKTAEDRPVLGLQKQQFRVWISQLDSTQTQSIAIENLSHPGQHQAGIAFVLLLDVSRSMAGQPFRTMLLVAKDIIAQLRPQDRLAIVSFGSKIKIHTNFTNQRDQLQASLQHIRPRESLTKLYLAIQKATAMLQRRGPTFPKRRAIFVVTDGVDEGSGLTLQDVIGPSREMSIPILSVGYSRNRNERYASLRRLSAVSGGTFIQSRGLRKLQQEVKQLLRHYEEIYELELSAPQLSATPQQKRITLKLNERGETFSAQRIVTLLTDLPPTPPTPPSSTALPPPIVKKTSSIPTKKQNMVVLWYQDWRILSGGGAGILLLFALFWLLFRAKPQEEPAFSSYTPSHGDDGQRSPLFEPNLQPTQASSQPLGILQLHPLSDKTKLYPYQGSYQVHASGLVVGRGGDIQVEGDEEVSTRHCRIFVMHRKIFVEDLQSRNGTLVNGVPVRGQQHVEQDDVLQLGRTKLRIKIERITG